MNIGKYKFNSKEQFKTKFNALHTTDDEGNLIPEFKFAIVEIGHILETKATQDEEGNELTPDIFSESWHVDAMWYGLNDHPYGWKSYSVDLEVEGMHGFAGISYLENKFK